MKFPAGHPAGRQVPLDPALEGRVKGHNIVRKVPYREATPFRAWSFTPVLESVAALPAGHPADLPVRAEKK